MPGWWYQESTCPFPQPTLQVRPQFPRQDLLGVEGKVRIMDSLALIPLPAADSSGEAGPGGLSALASPDQGRGLKGVPGGRKRQTDRRPHPEIRSRAGSAESLRPRLGRRWRPKAAVALPRGPVPAVPRRRGHPHRPGPRTPCVSWGPRADPRPARASHARALGVEETLGQLPWSLQLPLQGLGVKGGPHSRRGGVPELGSPAEW